MPRKRGYVDWQRERGCIARPVRGRIYEVHKNTQPEPFGVGIPRHFHTTTLGKNFFEIEWLFVAREGLSTIWEESPLYGYKEIAPSRLITYFWMTATTEGEKFLKMDRI